PELRERAQERELLARDLAGAEEGDALAPVFREQPFHLRDERVERGLPIDGLEPAARVTQERRGRAIRRAQRGERLPSLRAGRAEVYRIIRRRRQVDRLAFAEVNVERAARRAKPADEARGRVG